MSEQNTINTQAIKEEIHLTLVDCLAFARCKMFEIGNQVIIEEKEEFAEHEKELIENIGKSLILLQVL